MSKTRLWFSWFSCFSVPLGLDFVGRHVTLELFACNGVPGKLLNLPLWTEAPLSWIWEPSGWSQDVLLGGISLIMGPRNPGGCYFWKKKAPARNAPVVVGIGFHRKSQIQRILTKRVPFSEKVREAK